MDFYLFLGILAATIFTLLASIVYIVYGKVGVQEDKIITYPPSSSPSSSSSSPSSSWPLSLPLASSSRSWEHDVFPSFHGPDVRKHFLSHVLKAFESKGISFFNDNKIQTGESIGLELKRAIQESKIAIVLLSKNYASSSWCLDELVEIMNLVSGKTVLTIFHEVDPTHIKKQTGDFGEVFKRTCCGKPKEKTEKWRKALESVATIAGYHSRNWVNEAAMIENIACDISKMLNHLAPSPDGDCLIGMGIHMARMKSLLCLELDKVRMVGIWGPLGIGKSTIARFLFHQLSNNFRLKAIMRNIKGSHPRICLDEDNAQLELQTKMLCQMLNQKEIMIMHLGVAQERLKDKKVLLILDDVDRLSQLDALAKKVQWFGPGSRIIVTTENLKLLKAHGINHIYKVEFPTNDEALEIFCMYAFGQKKPKDGFMNLSRATTYLAGNLPLGLKIMGSYFRRMSKQKWERELPNLWSYLDGKIDNVLKFSYDALCDEDKNLFLHIACFFNGEDIERVEDHLANKFYDVRQRLEVLAEKSLISIDKYHSTLGMHSLLVQMGQEIVRKSDREPGQRQFLINDKDIGEVLTDPTTITRRVICIYSTDPHTWYNLNLNERVFEGMSNLQFLRLEADEDEYSTMKPLSGFLKYISPKLQLLRWPYSPITSLPFSINLEFFVELYMPHSNLEKLWEGIKVLRNLKRINLLYSKNLKELPNLSTATNLQKLNLTGCSSLVKLPSSIVNVLNLQELNLNYCSSLVELPSSIGNAINLQELGLFQCSSLVRLPSWIGNAINLQKLFLTDCSSLVELSSAIGNAINLQDLHLKGCIRLVELPSSIGNAINLQKLNLSDCSSLVELPSSIGNLINLQNLDLSGCTSLVALPSSIGNVTNLQELDLSGCTSLVELPSSIRNAINLRYLNLSGFSNMVELPPSIEISINLRNLCLSGCTSLMKLPSSIGNAINLRDLYLNGCTSLMELPSSIGNLFNLRDLYLNGCSSLVELPSSIGNLINLRKFELVHCSSLVKLPSSIGNAINLRYLNLNDCSSLVELPSSFGSLINLVKLFLGHCSSMVELSPCVNGCSRLYRLVLNEMENLVSLPQLPDSLQILDAEICKSLEVLDCSFRNPKIRLNFRNCFKLNEEARNVIIQTRTSRFSVLPSGEVPACFTYRAPGSSVTVGLNEKPPRTTTKFKACILLVSTKKDESPYLHYVDCYIRSKQNARTRCISNSHALNEVMTKHMYVFDVEAEEVTSTELVFKFKFHYKSDDIKIIECGILQLLELQEDEILMRASELAMKRDSSLQEQWMMETSRYQTNIKTKVGKVSLCY